MTRSAGFSLIEILVVIVVIAVVAAMALSMPRQQQEEESVRAAAFELAAVLRDTRARAIRSRSMYAVAFHLENAPGSSGAVLNNRTGGHWYRILGPEPLAGRQAGSMKSPMIPYFDRAASAAGGMDTGPSATTDHPIRHFLEAMDRSWASDRIELPRRRVRFLALTDQDNGDFREPGDTFAPTYPRPWCGWWDETSGRWYGWGGYDPDLPMTVQTGPNAAKQRPRTVGGRTLSHSGFFYEGYDGEIAGCVHPSDRLVVDDTNNDGRIRITATAAASDDATQRYPLWRQGEARPLIHADFGDYLIVFRPDGTVWTSWMHMRHEYARHFDHAGDLFHDPTGLSGTNADVAAPAGHFHLKELAPFDRCNRVRHEDGYSRRMQHHPEGSSFVARSGYWYITLAPDALTDRDTFATAREAVHAITPAYRVGVSPYGEVRVLRVRTTPPDGRALDSVIRGDDWHDATLTNARYHNHLRTAADRSAEGDPVVDMISESMLRDRVWWWE